MPNPQTFFAGGNTFNSHATSPDGITWTTRAPGINGGTDGCWAPSLGLFVIVGNGGFIATSPNGVTWTTRSISFITTGIAKVAWSPLLSLLVAVGSGSDAGKIGTSPNGSTWTQRTSPFGVDLTAALWAPAPANKFIIAGSDDFAISTDGINWGSLITSASWFGAIYTIAYSPSLDLFVAGGSSGVIGTSPDGVTWTQQTSSFTNTDIIFAIDWSPSLNLFVAAGAGGKLATSPDGVNWTQRTSSFGTSDIYAVRWSADKAMFVAGALDGKTASSTNGTSWTQRTTVGRVSHIEWSDNSAPNAPTLGTPAADASLNADSGLTFTWTHSDPDGDAQNGYAFRRSTDGGATWSYWTGSVWTATETFRTSSTQSVTIPAGQWVDGQSYSWSVATRDAFGGIGPYATARTFTVVDQVPLAPTLVTPAHNSTIDSSVPVTLDWNFNDPNDTQSAYLLRRKRLP